MLTAEEVSRVVELQHLISNLEEVKRDFNSDLVRASIGLVSLYKNSLGTFGAVLPSRNVNEHAEFFHARCPDFVEELNINTLNYLDRRLEVYRDELKLYIKEEA